MVSEIQARNKHKIPLRGPAVSEKNYTLQLLDNKYYLTRETKDPLSLYYYYQRISVFDKLNRRILKAYIVANVFAVGV